MTKPGYRYGVPEAEAQRMDMAYEAALRVIERHTAVPVAENRAAAAWEQPAARVSASRPSLPLGTLEKTPGSVSSGVRESSMRGRVLAALPATEEELTRRLGAGARAAIAYLIERGWIEPKKDVSNSQKTQDN